ncbi:MAG TPA: trypsin-like peptidase domain-containing protein [Candidatus Avanaerovorax faecigallinarum]|nr:trypsin-like peptidase domain-containing protein [Candidatus Avanaerovorax faecigallinarum]
MTNEFDRNNGYQDQNFTMRDPEPSENSGAHAEAGSEQREQYRGQESEYTEARTFEPEQQRGPQTGQPYGFGHESSGQEQQRAYTYENVPHMKAKKVKEKKPPVFITRKAFIITMICCMIFTSGLTVGGMMLFGGGSGGVGASKEISATNYTLAKSTGAEKSVEEIIAQNENAVVEIKTESVSTDSWIQNYVTEGAGSGVIVDTDGYIMTCNHVIDGASAITVTLKDGTSYEAKVIGADEKTDVAIIKIEADNLTAATYGNSDELSVGDLAVAIGNPLGELGGSATTGVISALDRELTVEGQNMTLLQTDASINPGNSGGGLFDGEGNLIGIVVAKSSGSNVEGLGFAIPINTAAEIGKELIENGHVTGRAALGVSVIDASDAQTAMQYGLQLTGIYIAEVTGSEAKAAGFERGDMIYYIDDTQIDSSATLSSVLLDHKPGDKVKVIVVRDGKTVELTTTLTEAQ